jgi:hypothetical protein
MPAADRVGRPDVADELQDSHERAFVSGGLLAQPRRENTFSRLELRRTAQVSDSPKRLPPRVEALRLTRKQTNQVVRSRLRSADSDVRRNAYDRFVLIRQWDGEVTDIDTKGFKASLITSDASTGRLRREHMRFPLRLVREQDTELVVSGAPFFYCVGRFVTGGQITPGSVLWFRRFSENLASTEALIEAAKARSKIDWVS